MPVVVNEVHTEVHAFDATSLLTEEVLRVLVKKVAEELARQSADEALRARDAEIRDSRQRRA